MLIAPALPIYYVDILSLSHHDQTIARCFYMGLGVIGSSFIWKKALNLNSPIYLTPFILLGFSLFPFTLLFAKTNPFFTNIAFTTPHLLEGLELVSMHPKGFMQDVISILESFDDLATPLLDCT